MVVVDAIKRADSVEAAKILAAMPATRYDGVIGKIEFDAKGDLKNGVITLYDFRGGKKSVLDIARM